MWGKHRSCCPNKIEIHDSRNKLKFKTNDLIDHAVNRRFAMKLTGLLVWGLVGCE